MTEPRPLTPCAILLALGLAWGAAEAQVPTFGSPYDVQRVEIKDPERGIHRVVTLTKRSDGDYDLRSLEVNSGSRTAGLLRNQGEGRFEGDIFDAARGTFRGIRVTEREPGVLELEETDYASGRKIAGEIRCSEDQCTYRRK